LLDSNQQAVFTTHSNDSRRSALLWCPSHAWKVEIRPPGASSWRCVVKARARVISKFQLC
jgi:hypothetical protein